MQSEPIHRYCSNCAHFCNDPAYLERVIPGIASLSSAYASVRSDDGICAQHDQLLSSRSSCADFQLANGR